METVRSSVYWERKQRAVQGEPPPSGSSRDGGSYCMPNGTKSFTKRWEIIADSGARKIKS